jgi:hypothetical protein
VQELLLLDDLLSAMLGCEGRFLRFRPQQQTSPGQPRFHLASDADAALSELLRLMLPLCDDAQAAASFAQAASQPSAGLTCHALSAAVRALLREAGFDHIRSVADGAGIERVTLGRAPLHRATPV